MKPSKATIPEALNRYLLTSSEHTTDNLAEYAEGGSKLVTPEAMTALRGMLDELREKTATIKDSDRLRRRIETLIVYFDETAGEYSVSSSARQDIAFALFYFLKGYDRIPDSIPDVGLLDDALVIDSALQRHRVTLRAHWARMGRPWTDDL